MSLDAWAPAGYPGATSSLSQYCSNLDGRQAACYWRLAIGDLLHRRFVGKNGSNTLLRRCGVGIVRSEPDASVPWGAFSALPGRSQTVPRAELYALVLLAHMCQPDAILDVGVDSLTTVEGVLLERQSGDNEDLWVTLWEIVRSKMLLLSVRWVKAHVIDKPELARTYTVTDRDQVGNAGADQLAGRAADMYAVSVQTAAAVRRNQILVQQVQRRLVSILGTLVEAFPRGEVPEAADRPDPLSLTRSVLASQHRPVLHQHGASCQACLKGCIGPPTAVARWLATPCGGPQAGPIRGTLDDTVVVGGLQVHPSHTLAAARGMVICTTCGGVGAFAPKKLLLPCGPLTRAGRRALCAFQAAELPYGTPAWPDDCTPGGIMVPLELQTGRSGHLDHLCRA